MRPFTVVEIDVPTCDNTYGTAPCTAAVGVTGEQKCFNTIRTCQDRPHFVRGFTTLRICSATENIPYDAIPCLRTCRITPGKIDPGKSIGERAKVSISCDEFPTGDSLFDRYVTDRAYNPFSQGTFWAKLRARLPSLQGAPLRVMRGEFGEPLSTFVVDHFFIETTSLDADGVGMVGKDALSFCDPKKAQCPVLSNGRLSVARSISDTSLTLVPAGIGNLEYPASGYLCLSNKEVVGFTRSADVCTITRGQLGSKAQAHDADAIAQLVKVFDSQSVANIVYELLTDFTPGVDASWCDLATWQAEADLYVGILFTAVLTAPTAVKTLLDEQMEQAGCSLWWDTRLEKVMFQSLRPVAPGAFVATPDRMIESSFSAKEQPDKRVSQHWTYYGLADPTNKVDKEANFRAAVAQLNPNAEADYGDVPAFSKVLARWIAVGNRTAAERLNGMKLARYSNPPRLASWTLFPNSPYLPGMGEGVYVEDFSLQNPDGSPTRAPFYVTSVEATEEAYNYMAEEATFSEDAVPDSDRSVFIDVDGLDVNLRTLYDSLYSAVPSGATITFVIASGAFLGCALGAQSLDVGTWPSDTVLNLYVGNADQHACGVVGPGGKGGGVPGDSEDGAPGGTALYTRRAIHIWNYGTLAGGGGGGDARITEDFDTGTDIAAGGGGGAGFNGYYGPGLRKGGDGGQRLGGFGLLTTGGPGASMGGIPGNGGAGHIPANPGGAAPFGPGGNGGPWGGTGRSPGGGVSSTGLPGAAVDGYSFVIWEVVGTILGPTIN